MACVIEQCGHLTRAMQSVTMFREAHARHLQCLEARRAETASTMYATRAPAWSCEFVQRKIQAQYSSKLACATGNAFDSCGRQSHKSRADG